MIWSIIAGCMGIAAAAIKLFLWWRGRRNQELIDDVIKQQKDVRLSIEDAEKLAAAGAKRDEDIFAGSVSNDDINRMLSGQPPKGG